jgi:L-iditol 2-dehydrogenase
VRVARLTAVGQVAVQDEPAPQPGPGETLVRVDAVGLCGSDLHWYADGGIGDAVLARPLVLGHEVSATVVAGPRAGERVAVDPAVACGVCASCLGGHRNLCPDVRFAGHGATDGGLRELMAWPDALLHRLPDALPAAEATVLEPLGVAVHALDLAHVRLGASVVVVGCGPIGLLVVQLARAAGATRVVGVEPLAHRREAALRHGADAVVDPAQAPPEGMYAAGLGAPGADVVLEVVGSPAAVELAVRAARPGGRVVLVGIPDEDRTTFPASVARRKGLTLAVARRMGDVYPRALDLVARGVVDVSELVTHRFALGEVGAAFATAGRRDGHKVVVEVAH